MRSFFCNYLNLLRIIMISSGLLAAVGCGKFEEKKEEEVVEDDPFNSFDPPLAYELHDQHCQEASGSYPLREAQVWGWQGMSVAPSTIRLNSTVTNDSLASSIVLATSYGRKFHRECQANGSSVFNCVGKNGQRLPYFIDSNQSYLRVCRDNYSYPRDTYESIALTSIYYLNESANFYQRVTGVSLSKVRLDVLPQYRSLYRGFNLGGEITNVATWVTNNLSYRPDQKSISVYPETRARADKIQEHDWESSFNMAHELGHHVETEIGGKLVSVKDLRWSAELHAYEDMSLSANNSAKSPRAKMWSSISEGFADLHAFYSNNADPSSIQNIKCNGTNRNVAVGVFNDGVTPKHLTKEVAQTLLGPKKPTTICGEVNFTDPHFVGAMLAFSLDQIFSEMIRWRYNLGNDERVDHVEERASLLYAWYKHVVKADERHASYSAHDAARLFLPVAESLAVVVGKYAENSPAKAQQLRARIQRASAQLLPVFNN